MKPYVLNLTDDDHKRIKLEATELGLTMKTFIMLCIKFYLEFYIENKDISWKRDDTQ